MQDFIYQNETKIIFGRHSLDALAEEISRYGTKILLHYGGNSIKEIGLYDAITQALKESRIEFVELPGVVPNPRLSLVHEGINLCRDQDVQFILAVGGGSPIDSAKAIAMGVPYMGDVWDFFMRRADIGESLPIGVVLTVAASGSESGTVSVITNEKEQTKRAIGAPSLRPKFALLDPRNLYTVPRYHVAAGGVDIMSHVMEKYFINDVDVELTDRLCEAVLKTVINNLPKVLAKNDEYNAWAQVLWAGTLAQGGLLNAGRVGDGSCHAIAGEVTGIYDTTHGVALSIITPAWMKCVFHKNVPRFAQFATRVWGIEPNFNHPEETALKGIRRTEAFFNSLGIPTSLEEVGIPFSSLGAIAEKCKPRIPLGNIKKLGVSDVLEILKNAYNGQESMKGWF